MRGQRPAAAAIGADLKNEAQPDLGLGDAGGEEERSVDENVRLAIVAGDETVVLRAQPGPQRAVEFGRLLGVVVERVAESDRPCSFTLRFELEVGRDRPARPIRARLENEPHADRRLGDEGTQECLPMNENIRPAVVAGDESVLLRREPGLQRSTELGGGRRLGLIRLEAEIAEFDRHCRTFIPQS